MSKHLSSKLFRLTGWFLLAGVGSYSSTRLLTPTLFPYWGMALLVLLGLWSALSVKLLLKSHPSRWVLLSLLAILCILSSQLAWSGLAGLLLMVEAIASLILIALIIGILRLLQRHPSARWLLLGFVPLLTGALFLGTANLKPGLPVLPAQAVSVTEEVRYLYELDQRDRLTGRFVLDATRDQARLQRILVLDHQRQITAPAAQYHAAMLLQHGTCPQHFQRAYELAAAAASVNIPQAESLAHASYDRWMLSIHQPQKYNTQWFVWQQSSCVQPI